MRKSANIPMSIMSPRTATTAGRGLPLEDSIASDALTVQDDGSEGSRLDEHGGAMQKSMPPLDQLIPSSGGARSRNGRNQW